MTRAPLALLLLVALSGCLAADEPAAAVCTAHFSVLDVPGRAGQEAGSGPRLVEVDVLLGDHTPVLAWWPGAANGTVESVGLRTSEGAHRLTVHAPAGKPIAVVAGWRMPENGQGTWQRLVRVPAGSDAVHVTIAHTVAGEVAGTWTSPVSVGVGPQGPAWQPQDLPELAPHLPDVESITFGLAWSNGPAGGADFGIAVADGADGAFHYTNAQYQAAAGAQEETRVLTAADLAGFGWGNGTPVRAGPSVSTGGFSTTGIAYTLAWTATLRDGAGHDGRVCEELGPVRAVDVTDA